MHVCVVAKWRKIFLWSWWRNIVNLQKNSGDEATYTFVSGLPCSESLDSAGGDHFEGLNPHCNGIWICEIVHFDTWRGLFAGWLWYMSNLTARFEWWMWGHRDYPCLCTWETEEDYIDILVSFLVLPVGHHREVVHKKYEVLWCFRTSQDSLLTLIFMEMWYSSQVGFRP